MSAKNMEARVSAHEGVPLVLGEGVGTCRRQVVGVTGAPGAWLNSVARCLEKRDALVLWPGQSLELKDARRLYEVNGENREVQRINDVVFSACNFTRFSGKTPTFFDVPFPGPREFLAKFPEDKTVVVADNALCLVWDAWAPYITGLIAVDTSPETTISFLRRWVDGNMTREECAGVHECYRSQLEDRVRCFEQVLRLDNAVLVSDDVSLVDEKVNGFLNSII